MQGNRKKPNSDSMLANFRYQRKWKRLTSVLSVFVVIGTVSALMLPAVTMNQYQCEQEAHSHAEDCYTSGAAKVLACSPETLGIHRHTPECCDTEQQLICNQADFVVHSHDSACYDAGGSLVCALDEIEEHTHSGECCKTPETVVNAGHAHSDSCYARVRSDTPTCGMEASDGHQHTVACQATGQELTCEAGEEEGHIHTEECYIPAGTLLCTLPESDGHRHTDDCYGLVQGELTCTAPEREPVIEQGEPILICEKPQVVLHSHGDSCYTPDPETGESVLTCSETVVEAHQHTDACFAEQEIKTLTCQIPEHVHTEECLALAEIADETQATAPSLTEEEQRQVDDVITTIDGLPPAADVRAELERLENAGNEDDVALYRQKMGSAVSFARTLYGELPEHLKEAVPNAARLAEYDFLFAEPDTSVTVTGQGHSLTATYGADAGIPAGSELHIQPIAAEDAQYEAYCAQISEALDGPQAQAVWLYDIGFTFGGAAVEPQGEVGLQLNFTTPAEASADTLRYLAVHFGTDGTEVLPAEPILEDGLLTGFRHTQSGFSPTAYVAVGPTDNPADNGPDWLPVDYYVYIDGAWTLVGSTKTGWYGTKKPEDNWSNTNRDHITVEQAVSILGPYGFAGYSDGQAVRTVFYQRRDESDYNLHNDTTCYLGASGKASIPLARNRVDTFGYNLYYSPATTEVSHAALSALTVPENSNFFSVNVLDANHLVYTENDALPQTQTVQKGKTVSVTVTSYDPGWMWVGADGTTSAAGGADNENGTTTYTTTVTQALTLSPKSNVLESAQKSENTVHWMVYIDGTWQEVGTTDVIYAIDGVTGRWFVTSDQVYAVLAPFGFDPAEYTYTEGTANSFAHQLGAPNLSNSMYTDGNSALLSDGKTWAIGLSYDADEYTMYYIPGYAGQKNWTAQAANTFTSLDGSRFYSVSARDDNHLVYAADKLQELVAYVPEEGAVTFTVDNARDVLWSSTGQVVEPVQADNKTTFSFTDIRQKIEVVATHADPSFTVQYYANIEQYVLGSSGNLDIIDTTGKRLPQNGVESPARKYLQLEKTGTNTNQNNGIQTALHSVKSTTESIELYTQKDYWYQESPGLKHFDKLYKQPNYVLGAVCVLKEGKAPDSQTDGDWWWYLVDESGTNVTFTNLAAEENAPRVEGAKQPNTNKYCILIQDGTVIRLHYETADHSYTNQAAFYDYDISRGESGGYSLHRAVNDNGSTGINSASNYHASGDGESNWSVSGNGTLNPNGYYYWCQNMYAFGNSNCSTGVGSATWNGQTLNQYNKGTFKGCTFGLVTGLDGNGNIIWDSRITAPYIFSEGSATGKTDYDGGSLTFKQVGDTYTLTAANSTVGSRSGLEYFFNPSPGTGTTHTHIFTNNFWVMDNATNRKDGNWGKWGTNAANGNLHCDKLVKGWSDGPNYINAKVENNLPLSDDGRNHNWFFGMEFALTFNLTADYVGPLHYIFFGDDDLWVFLDGQLICDIGGVHSSVGEYVDLRDYLPNGSSGMHTLKFFYTERGASGSTCWMSFTLPSVTAAITGRSIGELQITKNILNLNGRLDNTSFKNQEYTFTVDLLNKKDGEPISGTFSYCIRDGRNMPTYGSIKSGGKITMHAGNTVNIVGLPAGTWYEVTEDPDSRLGYSVTVNGESGFIASGNVSASEISTAEYVNHVLAELPATGGAGTILYTFSGWAVILTACALMYNNKRTKRKGRGDQTHIVPFSPDPENKNF